MKKIIWPTWEELEKEKREHWNGLSRKMKMQAIDNWREFIEGIFIEDNRTLRKKFRLTLHG